MTRIQRATSLGIGHSNHEVHCIHNARAVEMANTIEPQRTGKSVRLPRIRHRRHGGLHHCLPFLVIELSI
jgi:hypothetical protein